MKSKGFTLLELIVVIIIIAILAAIAVPLMSNIKNRAVITEAVQALGTVRAAMNNYRAEYQSYPNMAGFLAEPNLPTLPVEILAAIGINPDDFNGKYFPSGCYYISSTGGTTFTARCYVRILSRFLVTDPNAKSLAPKLAVCSLNINQDGKITQSNLVGTGY